ncbi:MAG: hypothetical protein AB7V27_13590 [Candidatus Binatia bacterium]
MRRPAVMQHRYDSARVPGFPEEHLPLTILHPLQFHDIWRGPCQSPERALAVAVLENAANDLRKYRYARQRQGQRFYMQAYQWVASDDREWPFSFVNLCEFLKASPEALREELLNLSVSTRRESEAA